MMITRRKYRQRGFWLVTAIIAIPILLAFGVFSVSLNNFFLAQTELQAAADAAALAGARVLFIRNAQNDSNNGKINVSGYTDAQGRTIPSAVERANATIQTNRVRGQIPETEAVQIGHWEFFNTLTSDGIERGGRFVSIPSSVLSNPVSYELRNTSTEEFTLFTGMTNSLNVNPYQANAVRVTLRSRASGYFFSRFLNLSDTFNLSASSVAYVGLSGSARITPPLAICQQAIQSGSRHNCTTGDYFQNGGFQWIRWTGLKPPGGPTLDTTINERINDMTQCGGVGNGVEVTIGDRIETTHAVFPETFKRLYDCWKINARSGTRAEKYGPDRFWPLTVPVVDCEAPNSSGFEDRPRVLGFITVNVAWMVAEDHPDAEMNLDGRVPTYMETWNGSSLHSEPLTLENAQKKWNSFVTQLKIKRAGFTACCVNATSTTCSAPSGSDCAGYQQKAIYLASVCNTTVSIGKTGGPYNFGVRAAEPVLVY